MTRNALLLIVVMAGVLYTLIDLSSAAIRVPHPAIPQILLSPLLPLNGLLGRMLDVDIRGGAAILIRAISFSAIVLANVMPHRMFQASGQTRYRVMSIVIRLWTCVCLLGFGAVITLFS